MKINKYIKQTQSFFYQYKILVVQNAISSFFMLFNMSKKYDFPPEVSFKNGEYLENLKETRLLGIQLHTNLKWNSNTSAIYKKCMSRMWLLRRMKRLNLDQDLILDYYLKEIRPLTEQGVIAWNSGLTKNQINHLEKVQREALMIILGGRNFDYSSACKIFGISELSSRREKLCTNFALKLYLSLRNYILYLRNYILYLRRDQFFTLIDQKETRRNHFLVKENSSRTTRCHNAPHNYIARLVNQNIEKILKKKKYWRKSRNEKLIMWIVEYWNTAQFLVL